MSEDRNAHGHTDKVEDLDITAEESENVKGGATKAGAGKQEYLKVELENVQITSYQLG